MLHLRNFFIIFLTFFLISCGKQPTATNTDDDNQTPPASNLEIGFEVDMITFDDLNGSSGYQNIMNLSGKQVGFVVTATCGVKLVALEKWADGYVGHQDISSSIQISDANNNWQTTGIKTHPNGTYGDYMEIKAGDKVCESKLIITGKYKYENEEKYENFHMEIPYFTQHKLINTTHSDYLWKIKNGQRQHPERWPNVKVYFYGSAEKNEYHVHENMGFFTRVKFHFTPHCSMTMTAETNPEYDIKSVKAELLRENLWQAIRTLKDGTVDTFQVDLPF